MTLVERAMAQLEAGQQVQFRIDGEWYSVRDIAVEGGYVKLSQARGPTLWVAPDHILAFRHGDDLY